MNHNTTLLFIKKYDLGEGIIKTAYFSDDDPQPDFIDIAIAFCIFNTFSIFRTLSAKTQPLF